MRIAIVDDCEEMLYKIQSCVEGCIENEINEIKAFNNPIRLLETLEENHKYDLYLLDIEMKQLSGLELAKKIRKLQHEAYIIFITSHSGFALSSYDIQIKAYQYILKEDINEKLPGILSELQHDMNQAETEYYVIQTKNRIEKIKYGEITHIHKDGKNAVFSTASDEYYERKTLNQVMAGINRPEFVFIDKGIIVNIRQIRRIEGSEVTFFDGTKVHISRSNVQKVKRRVNEYWGAVL